MWRRRILASKLVLHRAIASLGSLSVHVFVLAAFLDRTSYTLENGSGTPPNSQDLCCQAPNYYLGARVGTWIDVPGPFLGCPDHAYQSRMKPRLPEQERRSPSNVCIELVMQAPRAEHTYGKRG